MGREQDLRKCDLKRTNHIKWNQKNKQEKKHIEKHSLLVFFLLAILLIEKVFEN